MKGSLLQFMKIESNCINDISFTSSVTTNLSDSVVSEAAEIMPTGIDADKQSEINVVNEEVAEVCQANLAKLISLILLRLILQ